MRAVMLKRVSAHKVVHDRGVSTENAGVTCSLHGRAGKFPRIDIQVT
jgi:hypothetical protein